MSPERLIDMMLAGPGLTIGRSPCHRNAVLFVSPRRGSGSGGGGRIYGITVFGPSHQKNGTEAIGDIAQASRVESRLVGFWFAKKKIWTKTGKNLNKSKKNKSIF